uniref:Uncharacterized protein n=1 Tax=Ciona savignyi TaxID=51511 RepID=H2ZLC0_CIOSA
MDQLMRRKRRLTGMRNLIRAPPVILNKSLGLVCLVSFLLTFPRRTPPWIPLPLSSQRS